MTDKIIAILVTVLAAPLVGALISGLDRKITARVQGRIGPPILQPIYDVLKLLRKEPLVLNRVKILYVFLHLSFMIMVMVLLALGQDMLMALFAHAFSTMSLVLGGMSVRSPYSRIGSQRKIMQILAYEPILVLMVVGIAMTNSSFMAREVYYMKQPLLLNLPLIFMAFFAAILIKLEKSPFDVATSHHAHQELVKGVTMEFTGPYLAMIEITHFYEVCLIFGVIVMFWSSNLLVGLILAAFCFLAQIVVDNSLARLRTMRMVRFMWTLPLFLAVSNTFWFYL